MSEAMILTDTVLKGIMTDAVVARGYPKDLDAVLQAGVYQVGGNTENGLPGAGIYGVMVVYATSSYVLQVIYATGGVQYQRYRQSSGWAAWYKYQGIAA